MAKNGKDEGKRIRCSGCELVQDHAELCRRCRKLLPKSFVPLIVKEVAGRAKMAAHMVSQFDFEDAALAGALRKAGYHIDFSGIISMAKNGEDEGKRFRCDNCELIQFDSERCRRCKKALLREVARHEKVGSQIVSQFDLEEIAVADALSEADRFIQFSKGFGFG